MQPAAGGEFRNARFFTLMNIPENGFASTLTCYLTINMKKLAE